MIVSPSVLYSDLSAEAKPFFPPVVKKTFRIRHKYLKAKENVITKFITNPFEMPDLFKEYRFKEL
jgi:hypothetical protein